MKPGTREPRKAALEPAPIPPMDSAELEAIGLRLFGRVGWTVKIARLVGKDSSTLRRWRAGAPIEPVYAKMIRDYATNVDPAAPTWDGARPCASSALQALSLIARVHAVGSAGAEVSIRVDESQHGLALTLRIGARPPVVAWQDEEGNFQGLADCDAELARVWRPARADE